MNITMPKTHTNIKEIGNHFPKSSDESDLQYYSELSQIVSKFKSRIPVDDTETVEEQRERQQEIEKINTFQRKRVHPHIVHCDAEEAITARIATKHEDSIKNLIEVESSSPLATSVEKLTSQCNDGFDFAHRRQTPSSQQSGCSPQASKTPISGRILVRSNTMPCELFSDVIDVSLRDDEKRLSRSTTEKWQSYKSADNGKMYKIAAEKILERKKKKLRTFVTLQNHDMLEFDPTGNILAGNFSCSTTVKENEAAGNEIIQNHRAISPLQIVMLIVGTRGDVQPFIAIGKHLQEFGHRVRLATHANFRQFVVDAGLEYYPLGGDPKVLAGYMVRNKGLLPTAPSEISISWVQVKAILDSLLPACTESDGEHGAPFRAEAIIANPPAYGQVHVAEALKVPIHIFFTMPWTPTSEFPHPLSWMWNPAGYRLSYQMVDLLMWLGSRGLINEFRRKKLKLSPVTYLGGGSSLSRYSTLPTGYIWSSHLVPKPKDWGPLVDVVGFCFLDLASNFKAPIALTNWLQSGTSPIYFGFGSLPLEDPQGMTEIIVEALQQTHQRGIIDKGWGGMGTSALPSNFVYLIENCPHDWLFPQCVAVVHHGGAGTTAAGLRAACPTTIIPFFGDQLFWSERVHSKGVGPAPIPIGHLSVERLVAAIQFMLEPEVKRRAHEMAQCIEQENGVSGAVNSFHKHFPKTSQLRVLPSSPTPFNFFLGLLKRMCCY